MGCCCSSNAEDIYEGEENDRRNLLGSPDGDCSRGPKYSVENEKFNHSVEKIDDKGKLSKILEKTANSYIDVPALNSPVEQPDCTKTKQFYAITGQEILERHNDIKTKIPLLATTPRIEKVLGYDPLPIADRTMVNEYSSIVVDAASAIKVDYKEDIIIPFNG